MGGHGALIMALKNPGALPAFPRSRRLLTRAGSLGQKAFTAYLGR
jgi:S-formylglutathione hydrolase FrmB